VQEAGIGSGKDGDDGQNRQISAETHENQVADYV
jgi:hypothetical protein